MQRTILTAIAIAVFSLYIVTNRLVQGRPAATLETPLEGAIPLFPPAMLVYAFVYLFLFVPVVQVRDPRVFKRAAIAFYLVNLFSIAVFVAWPVRAVRASGFALDSFWTWALALNYHLDPPYNCFPSLHVGNAVFAALVAYRVDRPVGLVAGAIAAAIAASTLVLKQHWIADVVAGAIVGWAGYRLVVAGAVPSGARREELVLPRRYLVGLLSIYAAIAVVLYAAYRAGWRPFPWPLPPA